MLEDKITVASWRISDVKVKDESLRFSVNGFRFSGCVGISLNGESYTIKLGEEIISKDAPLSKVVEIIDSHIEHSADYERNVLKWIGNQ